MMTGQSAQFASEVSPLMPIIQQGGPFAAFLVLLLATTLIFWRYMGRELLTGLIQIGSTFRDVAELNARASKEYKAASEINLKHGEMLVNAAAHNRKAST